VRLLAERMSTTLERATRTVEERPGQDSAYVIDSSLARQELGWTPRVSIQEGLSEVVEWVDTNWDVVRDSALNYQHAA